MSKILLLNGPNLNLLGLREPEHYGATALDEVICLLRQQASSGRVELVDFQSNAEHELIDKVQVAQDDGVKFIIINPAALTHTSIGLRDALQSVNIPFIEVHLSNIFAREDFRKQSYFSDISVGLISGFGPIGYELALQAAVRYLDAKS